MARLRIQFIQAMPSNTIISRYSIGLKLLSRKQVQYQYENDSNIFHGRLHLNLTNAAVLWDGALYIIDLYEISLVSKKQICR